jgi:hypothetical protein
VEFGFLLRGKFIKADSRQLRLYATIRKVKGSSPDEAIDIFYFPNTSSRTTALGFTQPLT